MIKTRTFFPFVVSLNAPNFQGLCCTKVGERILGLSDIGIHHMEYRTGDWIIYRKSKRSQNPGPRAEHVQPAGGGEGYSYIVEKYWVVKEVQPDNRLLLQTRRGKTHLLPANDPSIHKANWWQRFRHRRRFEEVSSDM